MRAGRYFVTHEFKSKQLLFSIQASVNLSALLTMMMTTQINHKDPSNSIKRSIPPHDLNTSFTAQDPTMIEQQFQMKVDQLREEAETYQQRLMNSYSAQMVKLSKTIKTMKISEFNALYKCDLLQILGQNSSKGGGIPPVSSVPIAALQTPSHSMKKNSQLTTPSRLLRHGEAVFSQNGSPLVTNNNDNENNTLTATVKKHQKSSTFDIHVNGQVLSLENGNVHQLDPSIKQTAKEQLELLKHQMESLMKQLE